MVSDPVVGGTVVPEPPAGCTVVGEPAPGSGGDTAPVGVITGPGPLDDPDGGPTATFAAGEGLADVLAPTPADSLEGDTRGTNQTNPNTTRAAATIGTRLRNLCIT